MDRKAQTGLIVMVLLLLVFGAAALFLVTIADSINQDEYLNLFTHSFLLSLIKAQTGYDDPECTTVSDTLRCAFFNPGYACSNAVSCQDVVNATITGYAEEIGLLRENFRYLIVVESEGFAARTSSGEPFRIEVGDAQLKTKRGKRFTANERLQVALPSGIHTLKATVYVGQK